MSDSQQEAASRAAELERLRSLANRANRVAEKGLHMLEEEEGTKGEMGTATSTAAHIPPSAIPTDRTQSEALGPEAVGLVKNRVHVKYE